MAVSGEWPIYDKWYIAEIFRGKYVFDTTHNM